LEICIIFVTAYDEYAIEAIKHSAFDFLAKPVIPELLKLTIDRFLEKRSTYNLSSKLESLKSFLRQNRIKFNNHNGFVMLNAEDIVYCEANKNYCKTVLANGKTELITMQLGSVEEKLDKETFIRVNRSTLVNLDYLESFDRHKKSVVLSDILQKYELKVSASGLKRLKGL
jgi:two-component system LytT family response regulator